MFHPREVFRRLYKIYCLSAFKQVLNSLLFVEDLCICIEHQMERLLPSIDMGFKTSAQLHSSNIKSLPWYWTQLKTYTTCLFYLRRRPEHVLTCGHAICDICVMIFGLPVIGKECQFEVDTCILCLTQGKLIAKLKPATARA